MNREELVRKIVGGLEQLGAVTAIIERGSKSFGWEDEFSDIDLGVYLTDGKLEDTKLAVDEMLQQMFGIKSQHDFPRHPAARQYERIYKLESFDKFMVLDVLFVEESSPSKFLEREIFANYTVFLDRSGITKNVQFDEELFTSKLKASLEREIQAFEFCQYLIEKETKRGRFLDGLSFYHSFTLRPLVTVLRIKYCPKHHFFDPLRHLDHEMPPDVVEQIEDLYSVRTVGELVAKHKTAVAMFASVVATLPPIGL